MRTNTESASTGSQETVDLVKSVVSAKMIYDIAGVNVVAHHFCQYLEPNAIDPKLIIQSFAAMLCKNLPGFHIDSSLTQVAL